jgi:hypothetical protein
MGGFPYVAQAGLELMILPLWPREWLGSQVRSTRATNCKLLNSAGQLFCRMFLQLF